MFAAESNAPMKIGIVVMNPASGPGPFVNPGYMNVVDEARARGMRVLGYVATGHGWAGNVADDIAAYNRFYGVTDIFFDEAATDCTTLNASYRPWIDAVRTNHGFVVVNPGVTPDVCWAGVADVIVNFEGPYFTYLGESFPPWTVSYPPATFWHIVYSVPAGSAAGVIERATTAGAGFLYATADGPPNPYDTLADEYAVLPAGPDQTQLPGTPGIPGTTGAPIVLTPESSAPR